MKAILLATVLSLLSCCHVFAAERTPIPEVDVKVTVADEYPKEECNVITDTENCHVEEILYDDTVNILKFTLVASDNCYFSLKAASKVKLDGAQYMKAMKRASSTRLYVETTIPVSGEWKQDDNGRCFERPDGSRITCGWYVIQSYVEGETKLFYHYFKEDGYLLIDSVTPDGYRVDKYGVWTRVIKAGNDGANVE